MTLRIIVDESKRVIDWAALRFPDTSYAPYWGPSCAIGVEKNGELCAAIIFNNHHALNNIDIHVTSSDPHWMSREILHRTFSFPFETLKVRRITAKIGADNLHIKKYIEGLGFTYEGCARKGWNETTDLLIYGMLKDECRFLGKKYHGKKCA